MRNIFIVVLLVALGFFVGTQVGGNADEVAVEKSAAKSSAYKRVRIAEARRGTRNQFLRFPGATRAVDRASLTFLVSGTFGKSEVEIGDSVEAGQLLATIYNPQLKPKMNAAQSRLDEVSTRLEQVKKDVEHVRYLFETGAATRDELDQVESTYRALQSSKAGAAAQLAEATQLQEESRILAPFAGTVDRINFESGEFVSTGQPVIELNGGNALEVEINVPESLIGGLAVKQTVGVQFPFIDGLEIQGTIVELGHAARQVGQLFPVVVALPKGASAEAGLRAGLTAELVFNVQAQQGLQVPVQAVIDPGSGNARLFKLVDNVAQRVPVNVMAVAGSSVVVQGELEAGDAIVIAGQRALTHGERVEVLK